MKLRNKTLLIIVAVLLSLNAGLYAIASTILMQGYIKIEEEMMRQNVQRSLNAINEELNDLSETTLAWASWDDTYEFTKHPNSKYVETSANSNVADQYSLDFIAILNTKNQSRLIKQFDASTKKEIPISSTLPNFLKTNRSFNQHQTLTNSNIGAILVDEEVMLLASRPILTSQGEGPIAGSIIFGRYLTSAKAKQLSNLTRSPLTLYRLNHNHLPKHILSVIKKKLIHNTDIAVLPIDQNSVAGYTYLSDLSGQPILLLEVTSSRTIYQQGQQTVFYFLIAFLGVEITVGLVIVLLLEKMILARLSQLVSKVREVGTSVNTSQRISVPGDDELAGLANAINWMVNRQKQFHLALQKSQERYRTFVEQSSEGIWRVELKPSIPIHLSVAEQIQCFSQQSYLAECNAVMAEIYGFAHPIEMVGLNLGEVCQPWKQHKVELLKVFIENGYRLTDVETCEIDAQGADRCFVHNLVGMVENGRLVRIWGTQQENTAAKKAEAQIKISLREKEILLKEIHHRVKNNLQVVSSLLKLQANYLKEEKMVSIFRESQHRVRSMALVHETLYQSKDLMKSDFSDYIKKLVNDLFTSYGVNQRRIQFQVEISSIHLDIDTAIPCGLIINELVSNSLKYAFVDRSTGEIKICFFPNPCGRFVLIVQDNGLGIPSGLDFCNTESLGLQLVCSLSQQLGATIHLDQTEGTRFTIAW